MNGWLLNRLFDAGDQASPHFAFQGTINWIKAVSILVDSNDFSDISLKTFYLKVMRRTPNKDADTRVFENIFMSLHNVIALDSFVNCTGSKYDVVRSAIIAWYYAIYSSCSAMVAATSGGDPQSHTLTAKVWQNDIVDRGLIVSPFSLFIKNLVPKNVESEKLRLRGNNKYNLNNYPQNEQEALGAVYSYLTGTADHLQWYAEEKVRDSAEYKKLGVANFKTKAAQVLRDSKLQSEYVNFLRQAFRYRGKANYRDAIYLSYGDDNTSKINTFIEDLVKVARQFLRMSAFYVERRVEKGTWTDFINDLKMRSRLSGGIDILEL